MAIFWKCLFGLIVHLILPQWHQKSVLRGNITAARHAFVPLHVGQCQWKHGELLITACWRHHQTKGISLCCYGVHSWWHHTLVNMKWLLVTKNEEICAWNAAGIMVLFQNIERNEIFWMTKASGLFLLDVQFTCWNALSCCLAGWKCYLLIRLKLFTSCLIAWEGH